MNTSKPLLSAQNVSLRFDGKPVLTDISFEIYPNEIVTIMGPNGAGKSSLLRILVGVILPQTGKLTKTRDLIIGYVPQKLRLDPLMPLTVERFLKLSEKVTPDFFAQILDVVHIEPLLGKNLATLSGGEIRRVLLAHALLAKPNLLILDEPTMSLDQPGVESFYQLILTLKQTQNMSVLLVSHDLHIVMSASDRVLCLNTHICCQGRPDIVSRSPEYAMLFGKSPLGVYTHHHDHVHDPELCELDPKHAHEKNNIGSKP